VENFVIIITDCIHFLWKQCSTDVTIFMHCKMMDYIDIDRAVVNIETFAARAQVIHSPAVKKSRVDNGTPFYFSYKMHDII